VRAALANTAMTDCWALAQEADTFLLSGLQRCVAALNPFQDTFLLLGDAVVIVAAAAATQQQLPTGLCYYHMQFGPKAKRCGLFSVRQGRAEESLE